jgi:hypothetical protein
MVFFPSSARISAKPIHTRKKVPGDEPASELASFLWGLSAFDGLLRPEKALKIC